MLVEFHKIYKFESLNLNFILYLEIPPDTRTFEDPKTINEYKNIVQALYQLICLTAIWQKNP